MAQCLHALSNMNLRVGILCTAALLGGTVVFAQSGPADVPQPRDEAAARVTPKEYEVTGRVTTIDRDHGRLSLRTADDTLELHFPPSAIRTIKQGDTVTARLAIEAIHGTSTEGAGSPALAPETGSPPARTPAAP